MCVVGFAMYVVFLFSGHHRYFLHISVCKCVNRERENGNDEICKTEKKNSTNNNTETIQNAMDLKTECRHLITDFCLLSIEI